MNWDDYQLAAMRTKADQQLILDRLCRLGSPAMQLDNAVTGLSDEVGELNAARKKWIEYGQELDRLNVKEEVGDCLWRLAQICDAVDLSLQECAEGNINKLKKRYPEKYTDLLAVEANRDREVEREALVQNGNGWAEPPEEKEEPKPQPENVTTVLKELFMWVTKDIDGIYLFVSTTEVPPELTIEEDGKYYLWNHKKSVPDFCDFYQLTYVHDSCYPDLDYEEIQQVKFQVLKDSETELPENGFSSGGRSSFHEGFFQTYVQKSDTGSYSLTLDCDEVISRSQGYIFPGLENENSRPNEFIYVRLVAINEGE